MDAMQFSRTLRFLAMCGLLLSYDPCRATVTREHEVCLEGVELGLQLAANGYGTAAIRNCRQCAVKLLRVTPATRALRDGHAVPLNLLTLRERFTSVYFDPVSRVIRQIVSTSIP